MTNPETAGSKAAADVGTLLRARNPLIWIVSREEGRVERLLLEAAQAAQYEPIFWDCANGIQSFDGTPRSGGASVTDPLQVLNTIRNATKVRQVWILRDLTPWLRDPSVCRGLRSLVRQLPQAPRDEARAVILITPSGEVPPELADHAIVIEWPLPDRAEIADLLNSALSALPDDIRESASPTNGTLEASIDAAVGLTSAEAASCYAKSLVSKRKIDPVTVAAEKQRVIARERVLEWIDPLAGGLDAVGGLEALKEWLVARRAAFGPRARAYGLPAPKGMLMVGPPGTGKSFTAKAVASAWQMPLLRLDLGALKSKWVGDSEANIRKALRVAEAVAPCVVWVDEIEKALAGATQGAADGGVSSDALGTLLSWMQDRAGSVFVIATANDVEKLPPELLRKGRFDELWFVDLPTDEEREAILQSALRQYGREPMEVPLTVASTRGFTGAELAALVPDAMYTAFADNERPIHDSDLQRAAIDTVPLSKTASEKIERLRAWANERARPASRQMVAVHDGVRLDIDL